MNPFAGARRLHWIRLIFVVLVLLVLWYFAGCLSRSIENEKNRLFEAAVMELRQTDGLSASFDQGFSDFFDNEQIRKFQRYYTGQCIRRQSRGNLKMFGAKLSGNTAAGFGSVFGNAVNVYLLAKDPDVDRTFTFFEAPSNFVYLPPSYFFHDFAAKSPCPLYTDFDSLSRSDRNLEPFSVALNKDTQKLLFTGSDRAIFSYFGPSWADVRHATRDLAKRNGTGVVFTDKSGFIRAMWQPKPVWWRLLKVLWRNVIDENGRYFAMHIRRGDKISSGEMADIPMDRYLARLLELCPPSNTTCSRNVFVMHDDHSAYQQLKRLAGNQFKLLQLSDLLSSAVFDGIREHVLKGERGGFFQTSSVWYKHTRDLVLSLTLMAMAEHVVCTFSSNLARLVANINGNLAAFSSLDVDWVVP